MKVTAGNGLNGLTDKLYWREVRGRWHCFKLETGDKPRVYVSLCRQETITRPNGQCIDRPEAMHRCGICDGAEMDRRGHDESLPARPAPWRTTSRGR